MRFYRKNHPAFFIYLLKSAGFYIFHINLYIKICKIKYYMYFLFFYLMIKNYRVEKYSANIHFYFM